MIFKWSKLLKCSICNFLHAAGVPRLSIDWASPPGHQECADVRRRHTGEMEEMSSDWWVVGSKQSAVSSEQWTMGTNQWSVNSELWVLGSDKEALQIGKWTVASKK